MHQVVDLVEITTSRVGEAYICACNNKKKKELPKIIWIGQPETWFDVSLHIDNLNIGSQQASCMGAANVLLN